MSLEVDRIKAVEESDESGSDDIYLIVFQGRTVAPFESGLNSIVPGNSWDDFDTGETENSDYRVASTNADACIKSRRHSRYNHSLLRILRRKQIRSTRTNRTRLTLVALCLALLALPSAGSADNEKNCGCKNKEAVYKSVIVATSAPPPDFSPQNRCAPGGTVTIPVSGHDTVLGAFTGTHSHCVAPNSLAFTDGEYTATDADGNVLTGTYGGNLIPTEQPNVFLIDGRFSFTSGELVGEGAAGGRVVFNQDGTSDSIAVIDGCVTTKKKL